MWYLSVQDLICCMDNITWKLIIGPSGTFLLAWLSSHLSYSLSISLFLSSVIGVRSMLSNFFNFLINNYFCLCVSLNYLNVNYLS